MKPWEWALAVFSILLFLVSFVLYITDFPLRYYLLGAPSEGTEKIGDVTLVQGVLERQLVGDSEFRPLSRGASLYEMDTVVTSADGAATLEIEGAGEIKLGANTMVKLIFQNGFSLGGIERAPSVEVVAGEVTGVSPASPTTPLVILPKNGRSVTVARGSQERVRVVSEESVARPVAAPTPVATPKTTPSAAPVVLPSPSVSPSPSPTPSPSPSRPPVPLEKIELTWPKNDQVLAVDDGSPVAEKKVEFGWKIRARNTPVRFELWKLEDDPNAPRKLVRGQMVAMHNGAGHFSWLLKEPGRFEWRIDKRASAEFRLRDDFTAIKLDNPLVGGAATATNAFQGKAINSFDIQLKWEPYPPIEQYDLRVTSDEAGRKTLLQKSVKKTTYEFNKNKVFSGRVYYQVAGKLENGFTVHSVISPFIFNYAPPLLVMPLNDAVQNVSPTDSGSSNVLFTWQKTNFTESYDVEVAEDATFKKVLVQFTSTGNFKVVKAPPVDGTFYWRVRAHSATMTSGYSSVFRFTVKHQKSSQPAPSAGDDLPLPNPATAH